MRFIQLVLEPARYMDNSIHYHEILSNVSAILSRTLSEKKLEYRASHQQIFKYCLPELLTNNYFHAVFEGK